MSRGSLPDVDLRGFAWPLGSLERKGEHDVDSAAAQLAQAERVRLALQAEVESLESGWSGQLQNGTARAGAGVDPVLRRNALRHLAQSLEVLQARRREAGQSLARVQSARQALVTAQQRLDALRELRAAALGSHAQAQRRRQAREDDLLWLARRSISATESKS